MTEQENKITAVESRVSNIETKIDMFMRAQDEKFNNFIQEMRDRDNQRATEIRELRQKQDADMKEIRAGLDGMGKHVRNLSVATIIGVGTIAITVIYSILTR